MLTCWLVRHVVQDGFYVKHGLPFNPCILTMCTDVRYSASEELQRNLIKHWWIKVIIVAHMNEPFRLATL